jgi:DNA-binding LacI/PurR family transcriptional regulator
MSATRDHFREWMGERGFPCPETSFLNLAVPSASDALLWRLTRERRGVTALFSTGDEFILEAMNLLPREGISIPRDLSIVSVNRAPACDLVRPVSAPLKFPSRRMRGGRGRPGKTHRWRRGIGG